MLLVLFENGGLKSNDSAMSGFFEKLHFLAANLFFERPKRTMKRLYPLVPNITELCQRYNVKTLYAFGSVLTDKFNSGSDVDFVVEFNEIPVEDYADNYFDLKFSLQDILNRPVDLLEQQAIKNPYLKQNINQNKQMVYGK
jgi:predicted nucleotidyltransferase